MSGVLADPIEGLIRTFDIIQPNADYTIMGWFYLENIPPAATFRTLLYLGNDPALFTQSVWVAHDHTTSRIEFYIGGVSQFSWPVGLGWHHVCYRRTVAANFHELIIDGLGSSDGDPYQTFDASAETHTHLMLGSDTYANDWERTKIAYVREWAAALTGLEILDERVSPTAVRTANLHSDSPLEVDIDDISGNNRDWTVYGGVGSPPVTFDAQPMLPSVTRMTHTWTGPTATTTRTFSHISDGNPLYIFVSWWHNQGLIAVRDRLQTVTFNGVELQRAGTVHVQGNSMAWFYESTPPSGAADVVITFSTPQRFTAGALNMIGWPTTINEHTFAAKGGRVTTDGLPNVDIYIGEQAVDFLSFDKQNQVPTPLGGGVLNWNQSSPTVTSDQRSCCAWRERSGFTTLNWDLSEVTDSGDGPEHWGLFVLSYGVPEGGSPVDGGDDAEPGTIGPLVWVNWPRRLVSGTDITLATNTYSDHDMQCPEEWYGGFKEGRVIRFGDAARAASALFNGEWQGSTYGIEISDVRRDIRQRLHSQTERFWTEPLTIRMTTRANRAVLGLPFTVFVGPIIDVRLQTLSVELTLGDIISQGLLSDEHQIPWRKIGDGFLSQFTALSENLDREAPEPIIYGEHRRTPSDAASPHGFHYVPTYLGIISVDAVGSPSVDQHVWMIAGHACADVRDVIVWTPDPAIEGLGTDDSMLGDVGWSIPHHGAPAYEDWRSDTYGNDRRYTLLRAVVGNADADACVTGTKTLTVFVDGIEPNGDGSGEVITDRIQQYKHFLINYVANFGANSYQSGAWLSNPTWSTYGETVEIVDEDSFDDCSAIAQERLPGDLSGSPIPNGYVGAVIIGATSGDRSSVRRWLSEWNSSCGIQFTITRKGRIKAFMLHPTQAAKDAADLYTASYEILRGSFGTDVRWKDIANRIPFQTDYNHATGVWSTVDVAEAGDAISNYGRAITGELRTYPMAPGITMAYHLARLEVLVRKHPLRYVTIECTIGPTYPNQSLAYREIGDYIRVEHFDAVGSPGQIRLAQIVRMVVQTGKRRVLAEALDVEDLIGYDEAVVEAEILAVPNDSCAAAIVMAAVIHAPEIWNIDTTAHAQDTSLDGGSPVLWSGTSGYHAAWWKGTAPVDATKLLLTTVHSLYDTQLAAFTGACGTLTEVEYQDNDGVMQTSVLDIDVVGGTDYYVLVAGYGPNDGGSLTFSAQFYNPDL